MLGNILEDRPEKLATADKVPEIVSRTKDLSP